MVNKIYYYDGTSEIRSIKEFLYIYKMSKSTNLDRIKSSK